MDLERVRQFCLSLPYATEDLQWECVLFRVARKIFAMAPLDPRLHTG